MKRNTLTKGLLFAMLVTFGTVTVSAQSKGERKEPPTYAKLIEDMDKNEDGLLSKDEIKGPLKDDFSKIDTDEDGFISEEEFEKAPKPKGRNRN